MLQPKHTTWVVVADGARALILANHGPGSGLSQVFKREHDLPKTQELGADKPGRSFSSARTGQRSAMEPRVDWHEFEKQKFARGIADLLDAARNRQAFDKVVLVAPPETLGELRGALDKHTQAMIVGEVAKDLTKHPVADMASHLDGVIRL